MPRIRDFTAIFNPANRDIAFFSYTHWSHDLCPALLVPLMPLIKSSLGLSYLQSGLLLSAFAITSGLSQFIGGWVGDRLNQRAIVAAGLGGVGVAALAIGLTSSYYPMLVLLVIMGILSGAYHPSIMAMLAGQIGAGPVGKSVGIYMLGGSLAFVVAPVLGGLIADSLGWGFAFIILSIPALVASPLVLRTFRHQRPADSTETIKGTSGSGETAKTQTDRRVSIAEALLPAAVILILAVLMHLVVGAAMSFVPMYLVEKYGISASYAAMTMGIIRGGGLAGNLFGGWLCDKWGRRKTIFLILCLTGPALYLLNLPIPNALLIAALIIFGVVWQMRVITVQAYIVDVTPPYIRATVFGIYFGLTQEGMSLAQPVAGHLMDVFGIISTIHLIAIIGVVLSLIAVIPAILSRDRNKS